MSVAQLTWSDYNLHPDWEKPDAFSQRNTLSSGRSLNSNVVSTSRGQESVSTKDDNLPYLYKKLAKFLLKRESMKVNVTLHPQGMISK